MSISRRRVLGAAASLPWLQSALHAADAVVRFPTLHVLGAGEMAVMWATNYGAANPSVTYSPLRDLSGGVSVPATTAAYSVLATRLDDPLYVHRADLSGLTPGAEYFYRTYIDGRETPALGATPPSFRTPPSSGGFRFLAFGDSGTGTTDQKQIAANMAAEQNVSLAVHTGDIVYDSGTYRNYHEKYFDIYRGQMTRIPFQVSLGNHDVQEDGGLACTTLIAFPRNAPATTFGMYYSFDWGDVHFVCLDSNLFGRPEAEPMYEFLEADLSRNRKIWTVAYFHHPPYDALRGSDLQARIGRERVVPILDRHNVNLVLCGHHHGYARTHPLSGGNIVGQGRGTVYVITGGAGAGLHGDGDLNLNAATSSVYHHVRVDVTSGGIDVRAIRADGREFDRVTLGRPPAVSARGVVNAASFEPVLAPGSIVSIFGQYLAERTEAAARTPIPVELGGLKLTLGDEALPLFFVSPGQVNAQLPSATTGRAQLRLTTSLGTAEMSVTIQDAAPAIFLTAGEQQRPAIVRQNGSTVSPSNHAARGEVLSIYATGLGKLKRPLPAGQPAPASPLYEVEAPVVVYFGGTAVEPLFAGLAPGFAGLYQINARVPDAAAGGLRTVWLVVGGVTSNIVLVTVT